MLRDLKMTRHNSSSEGDAEIENVPVNTNHLPSNSTHTGLHGNGIAKNPKRSLDSDEEESVNLKSKSSKLNSEKVGTVTRTPIKSKTNTNNNTLLPTPERQSYGRNRFGFPSFNDETTTTISSVRNATFTPRVTSMSSKTYSSGNSDNTCAFNTPTKSVTKPPNPPSRHPPNANPNPTPRPRRYSVSAALPSVVDTVHVPHFDLKENPSFWMDHNVQVIIRVRPLNTTERNTHGFNRCIKQDSSQSITWIGQPETRFTFDHVACETVDQEMLFRMAGLPMVENCLSGYNSCMFAYGQTGSGKTYTMLGEMEDVEFTPSPHCGMTPRIFEFLFARIRAEEESRSDEKLKYSCRCSFLEIYNEQITDLLDPSSTNLLLREDVKNGVYVENLSEFEVHTVEDVLRLLIQGASNRKVAATNMNRESSRSHSVFTCIIESKWERDSTTNLRYARLNLVDLAGSERQKSSGAEGERLKEAANINKSLSTLGHVIMLLVDIAHGKPRHIPYRDSRLTFLLQDSLGGNSKTMIIANISPSICCAAETLNTLKFAQRAKLIQNNAVVNEDSSGDVAMLQHQILLLKEELSALKRQNPSRALAFDPSCTVRGHDNIHMENRNENDQTLFGSDSKGSLRVSSKQLKSMESMLAGALRREQMAESSIKKLEAEIEQLSRLVRQREEDSRCTKMMLKFREDKIHRMESLMGDLKPVDAYLLEENASLSEEIQLLRTKVDRNPEVTRFQDFYEEGERDILLQEVSELRAQLICSFDKSNLQQNNAEMVQDAPSHSKENESIRSELTCTLKELAECQSKLKSCLETNAKLSRKCKFNVLDLNYSMKLMLTTRVSTEIW
ncbi:Kinesin-like protein KIN-12D [Bienertia sinuspersici]